jgi:threonine synthase
LLYHLSGDDDAEVRRMMADLDSEGRFVAGEEVGRGLAEHGFFGSFADMERTHAALAQLWNEEEYLIDTHTAVAYAVYLDYLRFTSDPTKTLIASTASPYKFAKSIAEALGLPEQANEFDYIDELEKYTGVPVPQPLAGMEGKAILHGEVISRSDVKKVIERDLGL